MEGKVYDVAVIGAGPAGVSAAVYAARQGLATAVVSPNVGGQVFDTDFIENYPGFTRIASFELAGSFRKHLESQSLEIIEEAAERVEKKNGLFEIRTKSGAVQAKAVVIATGAEHKRLGVPGEERLAKRGVYYCAICDGPLFKGKDVVVAGGGNSAMGAALLLSKIGANKVYVVDMSPALHGEEDVARQIKGNPKIAVFNDSTVEEMLGEKMLSGVRIKTAGQEKVLNAQGIFVEIGMEPASEIVDFVKKNERGEIVVNESCETSAPGVFAAGDVTNVLEKQIVVAAGEGAKAALSAARYLGRVTRWER